MDQPKYVVCMQGVEGFVAEYGDPELAIARARELCTPQAETFVLAPVYRCRRTPAGRLQVDDAPGIDLSEGERMIVAERVLRARQQGESAGVYTGEANPPNA